MKVQNVRFICVNMHLCKHAHACLYYIVKGAQKYLQNYCTSYAHRIASLVSAFCLLMLYYFQCIFAVLFPAGAPKWCTPVTTEMANKSLCEGLSMMKFGLVHNIFIEHIHCSKQASYPALSYFVSAFAVRFWTMWRLLCFGHRWCRRRVFLGNSHRTNQIQDPNVVCKENNCCMISLRPVLVLRKLAV